MAFGLFRGVSLADVAGNRLNNITFMRLAASLFVLYGHAYVLSGMEDPISKLIRPLNGFHLGLPGVGVSVFFVLSGFLITRSYLGRKDLVAFSAARIFRIFPALIVAVLLCLVLGALVTQLPLMEYITHKSTLKFLLHNASLYGFYPKPPQVFLDNPWPGGINGSLWTLPVEFRLYVLVGILGLLGILDSKRRFIVVIVVAAVALYLLPVYNAYLAKLITPRLGLFFLLGSLAYLFSTRILLRFDLLLVLFALAWWSFGSDYYNWIYAIAFSYLTLFIAYVPALYSQRLEPKMDLSYGLYLYAYPVSQTAIYIAGAHRPELVLFVTLVGATILAIGSWTLIESPALGVKRRFLTFWTARRS